MALNPADPSDPRLAAYDGGPIVQAWLDASWRALQREVPGIADTMLSGGALTEDDVADVIIGATLRILRNPEGVESQSAAIDDYSESAKMSDATLDVYFTAAELRRLRPSDDGTSVSWAGSIKYVG